ncbi:hypothetical protein THAOC_26801, partial [Thalassiosira oceanica]
MLVLFGVNSEGAVVQNTAAWGYDADACEEPFVRGEEPRIGWVALEGWTGPDPAFCPAAATTTEATATEA